MDLDGDQRIRQEEFVKFYCSCLATPELKKKFFGRLYFDDNEMQDVQKLFKKYSKRGRSVYSGKKHPEESIAGF